VTIDVRETIAAVLDVWNGGAAERLDELLAPGYCGHMLGVPGGERDAAAYPGSIGRFRAGFPGVEFGVLEQIVTGDRCVSRLEAHRPGASPGASFVSLGINIARFDPDGRLAEEWAIWSPWVDGALAEPS
jgi:hypothetical protein